LIVGLGGALADAEEVRLVNGVVVRGEIRQMTDSGVDMQTEAGARTYPWYTLSTATRYRLQPSFRANFQDILAGRPAGDRRATVPPQTPKADADTPASAGRLALDDNPNISPIDQSKLPDWGAANPDAALAWALRYGPGNKDVAVLLFDVKAAKQLPDRMVVYNLQDARMDKFEARRDRRDGQEIVTFGPIRREAAYGSTRVTVEAEVSLAQAKPTALQIKATVHLAGSSGSSTFGLTGAPAGVVTGRKKVSVRDFLVTPSLSVVAEMAGSKPQLIGSIRMGRLRVWPVDGMDRLTDIQIREGNRVVWANKLHMAQAGDREPSLELGGLARGKSYDLSASANLGPYLGKLTYQDTVAIP
jgi:hypothetical protein